jgi:GNAT superfamily N-acetyltransferase
VLCAHDARGRLVGLAGIKTAAGGLVEAGYPELRAVYGSVGGLWRGLLLDLTERPVAPGEMLLDGLCVAPDARGQGIGSALIAALVAEARARGVARIRLDVIDRNPRARNLYLRHGFVPCGRRRMGPLRHVYGFRAAEEMERRP